MLTVTRHSTESLNFVFMRISRRWDARAEKLTPKLRALKSVKILPTRQARTCRRGRAAKESPSQFHRTYTFAGKSTLLVNILKNQHFIKSKTQSESQTVSRGRRRAYPWLRFRENSKQVLVFPNTSIFDCWS